MIRKFYEADHGYDNSGSSLTSGGKSADEVLKKHIPNYKIDHYVWPVHLRWDMTDNISQLILAAMEEYASQYAHQQPVQGYSREQMDEYGKKILKSISDTFLNSENLKKASLNDQVVIQAVGETILNFPLPEIEQPVNDGWEGAHNIDDTEPPKQSV